MKEFEISWRDEVHRSINIKAKSKEVAIKRWERGEFEFKYVDVNDCICLSDENEIVDSIIEIT